MALQELERQKNAKLEEIKALQHSNSACEEACKALQGQLTKLNDLEQVMPTSRGLGPHPQPRMGHSALHACICAA